MPLREAMMSDHQAEASFYCSNQIKTMQECLSQEIKTVAGKAPTS